MRGGSEQQQAGLALEGSTVRCTGEWTVPNLNRLEVAVARAHWPAGAVDFDMAAVTRMDTGGAWLLHRLTRDLEQAGHSVAIRSLSEEARGLFDLVRQTRDLDEPVPRPYQPGAVEAIGRRAFGGGRGAVEMLAFTGEMGAAALWQLMHPARMRWRALMTELADAGHKALPIVGLLSFLLGIVIAYQGGIQLRQYGANIFVVDLVGLSMLRELAPMITAIIVAGRTGSAYTAQIGTMQVTEEVDALRSIGITPMELLVLPKVFALLIALPLLTVYSDIMGVLGGMVMASAQLGVGFNTFLERLGEAVSLDSYLVGVGKAPVFAVIVATIGCYQGFRVGGSAESVGRHTTISVVQSILAVIVVDAAFSVVFSWLGI